VRKLEYPPERKIEMSVLQIVLGAVLLAASLFLIVVIMLQDKKKRGLSGAIAGGTDTYLGRNGKNAGKGKFLSKMTTVVAIVFVVIVVVSYLFT
jgi:preprotein translocase, secG subunit